MKRKPAGLDAFAAARAKKPTCSCCALRASQTKLWQEVLNGRARPVPHTYPTIASYLRSEGVEGMTANKLRDHFLLGHEETR
jgi:hypothetical protein